MLKREEYERSLETLQGAVGTARKNAGRPAAALVLGSGRVDQTTVAFNVFTKLLESDGVRAALYSVLRRSDYRFLSIFRFKDGKATSCVHIDRDDLNATQAGEVPDTATYCSFVRAQHEPFFTANAPIDARAEDHPARNAVMSYCGIPVLESDGTFIGTLCHYDLIPRDPEQLDLELLLQVSSALAQSGRVPAYPNIAND